MDADDKKSTAASEQKFDTSDNIMLCVFVCIVLAIAFLVTSVVYTTFGSSLPLWAAAVIGIVSAGGITFFASLSNSHTLLETIITLSIILVLGIILVPVFKQAQQKALMKKAKAAKPSVTLVIGRISGS